MSLSLQAVYAPIRHFIAVAPGPNAKVSKLRAINKM
jgi:hypothetical protein